MSIEERRMDLAVDVVARAMRGTPEADVAQRLLAFRRAYVALADLDAGDDGWTEDLLAAAWELVEDAWPRGGPVDELIEGLSRSFRELQETVKAAPEALRRKPRRDA